MRYGFYDSPSYKNKQSEKTKLAWLAGHHQNQLARPETRKCKRGGCAKPFEARYYEPKKFCSSNCAASFNNGKREQSRETRQKIAASLRGRPSKYKGKIIVPRLIKVCLTCGEEFSTQRWQNHKYCSVPCAIKNIGARRTSPKAARAKAGVRPDISSTIYFYSRWEANFARVLNLLRTKWEFQHKTFDLGFQNYTPDFYLPESDTYVEIKNFLSDYSSRRHNGFKKLYPEVKLILVLMARLQKLHF